MPDKSVFSLQNVAVSVLGGVAAAVIFTVVSRGGGGGLAFAHLAPLPLMIIALGYGVRHGATAALIATTIISIYPHPVLGMAYALLVAAPAWLACYALAGAPRGKRDFLTKNLPAWGALAPATILACVVILWLIVAGVVAGSLDEALNPIRARIFILLEAMSKEKEVGFPFDPVWLSGVLTVTAPAMIAFYILLIHIVNLWIAGRLSRASGLLTRPWPDIAAEFHLPKAVGGFFLAGFPDFLGRRAGCGRLCGRRDDRPRPRVPGARCAACPAPGPPVFGAHSGSRLLRARPARLAPAAVRPDRRRRPFP